MKTKAMYALEYKSFDGGITFDIFETYKKAKIFAGKISKYGHQYWPLFIFRAKFNNNRIFKEDDNWNYDDFSDTFNSDKIKILKHFAQVKNYN